MRNKCSWIGHAALDEAVREALEGAAGIVEAWTPPDQPIPHGDEVAAAIRAMKEEGR